VSFYLVPSLVALRDEINARYPKRDKSSDGWVGDTSHAARKSSHNPDYSQGGAVRAIDIDVDDNDPTRDLRMQVLDATVGDHRVWYVISNGIIYSDTYGWRARKYTGSNPHTKHVHVSVKENPSQWKDTSRWLEPEKRLWQWNPDVISELALVQEQFQIAAGVRKGERKRYHGIAAIQNALNVKAGADLAVDGWVGQSTIDAWKAYERKAGGTGRLTTPDPKALGGEGLQIMYRFTGPEAK
jgi:hypothetical protein